MIKTKQQSNEGVAVAAPSFTPLEGIKIVVPIKRLRKGTPVSHETNFKFGTATEKICLPYKQDPSRTVYVNPFKSDAERDWIADQIGEDLNIYKAKENFFDTFRVELGKSIREFNLSDALDLLSIRVLEVNNDLICTNPENRMNKITYKWIMSDDGFQESEKEQLGETKIELWSYFDSIKNDREQLRAFLKLRNLNTPQNVDSKWLRGKVIEELEANPTECYMQIQDPDKEWKILFDQALESRAIYYSGEDGYIIKGRSTPFAYSKQNVIEFLKDKRNTEDIVTIKAYINDFKVK